MIDDDDPAAVRLRAAWRVVHERRAQPPPRSPIARETPAEAVHLAILADALGVSVLELRRRGAIDARARAVDWRRTVA